MEQTSSEARSRREGLDIEKYLTAYVADESYGIGVEFIRQIIRTLPITPIPSTPPYVLGVANVRGKVTPVVSLRARLGLEEAEPGRWSCIVVVETQRGMTGVLVERVSEVVGVETNKILVFPDLNTTFDKAMVRGVVQRDEGMFILLAVEELLKTTL